MSTSASKNGRPTFEHAIPLETDVVPFPETGNSTPKFGSVNAAATQVNDDGLAEMTLTMFQTLGEDFRRAPLTEAFDLDLLTVHELLPGITAATTTLNDLADVAADDLLGRRRVLTDLVSGKATRLRRRSLDIVNEHIDQRIRLLRVTIEDAAVRAPFAFVQQADDLLARLRTLDFCSPPATAYSRFMKLSRTLSLFEGGRGGTPPHIVRRLIDTLQVQLDMSYLAAIEEATRQLLTDQLRDAANDLVPFVEERRRYAKQFSDHLFQVEQLLDSRRTAERHRNSSPSSTDVVLSGATANELSAALRAERRVGDLLELVRALAEQYEQNLREIAADRYPTIASGAVLGELLTRMEPVDLAFAFCQVTAAAVASLHTVYTAIAKQGVENVVRRLLQQGAVLCDLNRRDHVDLNCEPHELLIVRCPLPIGREDAAVRERMREAFLALGITCVFCDGNADDRNVSVIRTRGGMPLGLLATNEGLLQDYLDAHELGHRPHLYGLLPECPDGQAVPQLLELARLLRQQRK